MDEDKYWKDNDNGYSCQQKIHDALLNGKNVLFFIFRERFDFFVGTIDFFL